MHKPGNRKFSKIDFFRFLEVYQPSGAIGDVGMASFMRKMIKFLSKKAFFLKLQHINQVLGDVVRYFPFINHAIELTNQIVPFTS